MAVVYFPVDVRDGAAPKVLTDGLDVTRYVNGRISIVLGNMEYGGPAAAVLGNIRAILVRAGTPDREAAVMALLQAQGLTP